MIKKKNSCVIFLTQVQLGDKMLEVWVREKSVKFDFREEPETLAELQSILRIVGDCAVCIGGPPVINYPDSYSEVGYKDGTVWRHADCSILLEKGKVCIFCIRMYTNLERMKMSNSKKRKRLRTCGLTPSSKKVANDIKQDIFKTQKHCSTKELKLIDAYREIEEIEARLKSATDEAKVMTNLKSIGTSKNQVKISTKFSALTTPANNVL